MGIGCHCRYHGVSRTVLSSLILALLLFSGPSIAYGNFDATTIGTYGDITVMEVTGSYDANASDQQVNALPRKIIAQEFYSTHPDDYDFIVIYANFDFSMPTGAVAFYQGVRNDVQGIGKLIFDNSASYGSDGQLQGTIDMGNVANLESDPFDPDFSTTMGILCHELLHRWAAYVKFEKWDGTPDSTDLLGKDLSHWSYLLDTNGSLLYGNDWEDNGDNTFTSLAARKYYSPLDMYLMGFVAQEDVPPMLLIENPAIDPTGLPEEGVTIDGTPHLVSIDDIIAYEGDRVPGVDQAQKAFRTATVFVTRPNTFTGNELFGIGRINNGWVPWFASLTDGRATINTDAPAPEDVPRNPGPADPGGESRTAPPDINEGVAWLIAEQMTDGRWSDTDLTDQRDTAQAVAALLNFSGVDQNITDGAEWLDEATAANLDFLARKIEAMYQAGASVTVLIDELVNRQNPDGGWGSSPNYLSNAMDTALALKALAAYGHTDGSVIGPAIDYLKSKQLTDGGWGSEAGISDIQTTANVLTGFQFYTATYSLEAEIQTGLTWLLGKQNTDGGFGNSPGTVYDTAAAMLVLRALNVSSDIIGQALDWLLNQQFKDGSWMKSAFQTALALRAAWAATVDPDLAVSTDDIVFTPEDITGFPRDVDVTVTVWNKGRTPVVGTILVLYEGSIEAGNEIDQRSLDVSGMNSESAVFSVSITEGYAHTYIAVVDPGNTTDESRETNNTASRVLYARIVHDPTIPPPGTFDNVPPGSAGDDNLNGNIGNDLLEGLEGDDTLNGGAGNDWLVGGPGNDFLRGGSGDDTYLFNPGDGQDEIDNQDGGLDGLIFTGDLTLNRLEFLQDGDDLIVRVTCSEDRVTILDWFLGPAYQLTYIQPAGSYGLPVPQIYDRVRVLVPMDDEPQIPDDDFFDEVYEGSSAGETVTGTLDDDLLLAFEGDDSLSGYAGNDWLVGGSGVDSLWGDFGNDVLLGGPGNDNLYGEEGDDVLYGGGGSDYYFYRPNDGKDVIYNHDDGVDRLIMTGAVFENLRFLRLCDDLLIWNTVNPQEEVKIVDWFVGPDFQLEWLQCGVPSQGQVTVHSRSEMNQQVEILELNIIHGTPGADDLTGTVGDDWMRGDDGNDHLDGDDGNDHLDGDDGNDLLDGGPGDDVLIGGNGEDELNGEDGDDRLGGDPGDDELRGGSGNDTYIYSPGGGVDTIDNQDGGMDVLEFTDDLTIDRLSFMRRCNDLIIRVDGDPNQQVTVLNWFLGGDNELTHVQPAGGGDPITTAEINHTAGDPDLQVPAVETFDNHLEGDNNPNNIWGIPDTNLIEGYGGVDQLVGHEGNDWLLGGDGGDFIWGSAGDDVLLGGDGGDQLSGDEGNDLLHGGSGNDIYVFGSGHGADIIKNLGLDTDWLLFGSGLTMNRLHFIRRCDDLDIRIDGNSDEQVTIENWFVCSDYQISYIQPDGSGGIPAANIEALVEAVETCAAPGDFDGNGVVDGLDLVMLINNLSLMDIGDFAGVFGH